jgi:hypothetical protein
LTNNGACTSLRYLKGFDEVQSRRPAFGAGLEVSPVHFLDHVNIKGLIGNNLFWGVMSSFHCVLLTHKGNHGLRKLVDQ